MSGPQSFAAMQFLVERRGREQDRIAADLARQQGEQQRFIKNLTRLDHLCEKAGVSGSLPIGLATNCGDFKQFVMGMAQSHRNELSVHEQEMATTRQALVQAVQQREAMAQVLGNRQRQWEAEKAGKARKQSDDIALNVWRRGVA